LIEISERGHRINQFDATEIAPNCKHDAATPFPSLAGRRKNHYDETTTVFRHSGCARNRRAWTWDAAHSAMPVRRRCAGALQHARQTDGTAPEAVTTPNASIGWVWPQRRQRLRDCNMGAV
jgi:hypothetical protein